LKDLIVSSDRGRQQFTRIQELAESIERLGLIHPIVVAVHPDKPGKYILVAGERRYRGAVLAGVGEVPATLRDDAEDVLAEIEYEENVCRSDVTYEEEGRLLKKIQQLKKKHDPKWTLEQTAQLTNRSTGDVSTKINIVEEFEKRPDLKEACSSLPYTAAVKKVKQIKEAEKVQRLADQGSITLTTDLRHGDCRKLIGQIKPGTVDCVVTDPPYGIEKMENIRDSKTAKLTGHLLMSDTHNLDLTAICELLNTLAPELHRVMKEGAHFYMFCGFQYISNFIACLEPHLEFQPPILIWDRLKPSSPGMGYNYLSRCEAIIYGHRPPRGRRLADSMYNIIECPDVPKNLRMYPTEKPVPLLKTLIKQSTDLNAVVLDPFAGSASTLSAARGCGRRAIGFEVDRQAFLRAQKRLQKGNGDD
jgi:ParB/RepB/Spo0J family partition protein